MLQLHLIYVFQLPRGPDGSMS